MQPLHAWNLTPDEAIELQLTLRNKLVLTWDGPQITTVGGVDMSLKEEKAHAAIAVFSYPDLKPLEAVTADAPLVFPYIPGLLGFREGPAVLAAWDQLQIKPDLLMFDGQGIAHPRGFGIAAQMGLWLKRPSIGVAKSRLYGLYDEPGPKRGDMTRLYDAQQRVIGMVFRTRERGKPLYISPGHLIDLPHALEFVVRCGIGYRLPEPTRWAHKVAAGEKFPLPA
ncbi:MAG: deoxyribonuclease V [Chloroflexi bacterium]|nr:deoxyribonuclease V [Chloroflexota bacterium]MBP8059590.1 deoxyribonuclease V [Chloroflexota bacterium]